MISQIDLVDVSTCKKAKLGRRVVQLFIDFFLVFIVSFSLYAFVCQPIVNALPITAKNNQTLQEKSEEVTSIIEETHLQKRGENGRLVPLKTGAQNYVKSLVKTSCLTLGIDYYQLGIETGKLAAKILKGEATAEETAFISASKAELYVNKAAAAKVNLTLDEDYIKDAAETFDEIVVE